jgi:hypothetical protein
MAYLADEMRVVQYRPFPRMRELAREYMGDRQPSIAELKESARRQGAIVQLDANAAIEALPELVPDMRTRRLLPSVVYQVATASAPLDGERAERFAEVQRVLGVEPGSEKEPLPPPPGSGNDAGGTGNVGKVDNAGDAKPAKASKSAAPTKAATVKKASKPTKPTAEPASSRAPLAKPARAARRRASSGAGK